MRAVQFLVAWFMAVMTTQGTASTVLMTFEDFRPASITSNTQYQGFWISPSCHLHTASFFPPANPAYLGFDADSCSTLFNPDYLGAYLEPGRCLGCVYMARVDGGLFNLDGFDDVSSPFSVESSAGGYRGILQPSPNFHETFTGPEWQGLTWIVFRYGGGGEGHGLDNLALTVPEPPAAALLGAGMLLLVASRRIGVMRSGV